MEVTQRVKGDKAMHERDDSRRGARGGADERETRGQEPPRAEGCVLLVLPSAFEEGLGLIPQRPPIAVGQWTAILRREGYTAHWMPASAIEDGPYAGGIVVMATRPDDGRHYIAVPPEAVHALAGVLSPQDYRRAERAERQNSVCDERMSNITSAGTGSDEPSGQHSHACLRFARPGL